MEKVEVGVRAAQYLYWLDGYDVGVVGVVVVAIGAHEGVVVVLVDHSDVVAGVGVVVALGVGNHSVELVCTLKIVAVDCTHHRQVMMVPRFFVLMNSHLAN